MADIQFIKYDGKWPCLCSGTLSIKVNNKTYHLEHVMHSGGCISHDGNWDNVDVISGPWTLDLGDYPELQEFQDEIEEVVNDNVTWGCCGGCV